MGAREGEGREEGEPGLSQAKAGRAGTAGVGVGGTGHLLVLGFPSDRLLPKQEQGQARPGVNG